MKYKIFILFLFLFLSCDKSFDASKPFSYNNSESKISSFCKGNSDCKKDVEICDLDNALCVINPCYDVKCGGKGECKVIKDSEKRIIAQCECKVGYETFLNIETNEKELICKKTCENSLACKEGSHKVKCDQDEYSVITCECGENYKQNEEDECVNPCENTETKKNEVCISDTWNTIHKECVDNYHYDANKNCFSLCENHENCSENNIDKFGVCISSSLNEVECICNTDYVLDENDDLICIINDSCLGVDCNNHGQCNKDEDGIAFCSCATDYQDYNKNLTCMLSCNNNDCKSVSSEYQGECFYNEITEIKECNCGSDYQDSDKNLTCELKCGNLFYDTDSNGSCDDSSGTIIRVCNEGYENVSDGYECAWSGYAWTKVLGVSSSHLIIDRDNNLYVAGRFSGQVDFDITDKTDYHSSNGEAYDVFLTKYNNNGEYLWTKTFGTDAFDDVYSIVTDSKNNIYLLGIFMGTGDFNPETGKDIKTTTSKKIFLTKFSGDSSYAWTKVIDSNVNTKLLRIDDNDNLYIAGIFQNTVDFNFYDDEDDETTEDVDEHISNGDYDVFIMKLDENGFYLWTKTFGATQYDEINSVIIKSNKIYYTGKFRGEIDFDPSENSDIHEAFGATDAYLSILTTDGEYIWTKTIKTIGGNDYHTNGKFLALDSEDNLYITGEFKGRVDFDPSNNEDIYESDKDGDGAYTEDDIFVTKLNSDGDYLWTKIISSSYRKLIESIKTDKDDNLFIAGTFKEDIDFNPNDEEDIHSSNDGSKDIFLIKLNSNGSYSWTKTIGGTGSDNIYDIFFNKYDIYMIGRYSVGIDFNPSDDGDDSTDFDVDKPDSSSGEFIWKYSQEETVKIVNQAYYCNDIDCGNGHCDINEDSAYCICNTGYQDNDNDLLCEPTCDNPTINNCGEHGICDDSNGNIICLCDVGYILNGSFQCDNCDYGFHRNGEYNCINDELDRCDDITCDTNAHCIEENENSGCICDDNYHLNGNYECIDD